MSNNIIKNEERDNILAVQAYLGHLKAKKVCLCEMDYYQFEIMKGKPQKDGVYYKEIDSSTDFFVYVPLDFFGENSRLVPVKFDTDQNKFRRDYAQPIFNMTNNYIQNEERDNLLAIQAISMTYRMKNVCVCSMDYTPTKD